MRLHIAHLGEVVEIPFPKGWLAYPVNSYYRRLFWLPAAVFERRAPAVKRGGSNFTTITRKYNRYLLQPPNMKGGVIYRNELK